MGDAVYIVGSGFCIIGGALAVMGVLGFVGCVVTWTWQKASSEFRAICKAESLIFEYKKEREEYLEWKKTERN